MYQPYSKRRTALGNMFFSGWKKKQCGVVVSTYAEIENKVAKIICKKRKDNDLISVSKLRDIFAALICSWFFLNKWRNKRKFILLCWTVLKQKNLNKKTLSFILLIYLSWQRIYLFTIFYRLYYVMWQLQRQKNTHLHTPKPTTDVIIAFVVVACLFVCFGGRRVGAKLSLACFICRFARCARRPSWFVWNATKLMQSYDRL